MYADAAVVWHTKYEFTLDFLAPTGGGTYAVTSRVRVPTEVIFQIAQAISENVSRYEQQFGPLGGPSRDAPAYPPEGWGEAGPG